MQNFRAKKGTLMADAPEPSLSELLWTVAMARLILGPAMSIQVHDTMLHGTVFPSRQTHSSALSHVIDAAAVGLFSPPTAYGWLFDGQGANAVQAGLDSLLERRLTVGVMA